ncbi:hypothetical protein G4Y73_01325 [Wenzhouxiangella sp. XN201]|uniref:hypothetical protein n=1 Tax=Wenzhouxiangella sp. XN201 TaxID=2710755 RepID=UPI0013CC42B5|nr:hypothetical protein [Wenzhouxiangella sp. XN201]NEZ02787.1 hypothetical protein [Wenzhouxiangella sp. XN201]
MTTTRIHSTRTPAFVEFQASPGHRRPVAAPSNVDVAVIGHSGQVGSALLARLDRTTEAPELPGLQLREGINRSRHLLVGDGSVNQQDRNPGTLSGLGARLLAGGRPAVIVDCTADATLPRHYPEWLRAGIGVVTPNKHGFSGDPELYRSIMQAARKGRAPLNYSATVGAGLPVIDTLKRLRRAGVKPAAITAAVSGTLSHVFTRLSAGQPLSEAVADARHRGFTEPDPLEDLSGRDVARKLVIMLREAGLSQVRVELEPVVPDAWAAALPGQVDTIEALREKDAGWREKIVEAQRDERVWTYLARFDGRTARVGPVEVSRDSAFAGLAGSGNRISIESAEGEAIDIHGPGAGVDVTATAVLADLVDAAFLLTRKG